MSSGQNFGGVLAYRLAALFAIYFASYYTVWEALIVTLPGEAPTPMQRLRAIATLQADSPILGLRTAQTSWDNRHGLDQRIRDGVAKRGTLRHCRRHCTA